MPSIEQKTAETILQRPIEEIIGGETYTIAPPSSATIILVSELVSQLPAVQLNPDDIASETLYIAKDCGSTLGEAVAVMILGAKNLVGHKTIVEKVEKRRFFGLIKEVQEVETDVTIDNKAILTEKLLNDVPPSELHSAFARLLKRMEIGDFFGLITSLLEINLLRQTREVKTTASGQ